MGVKLSTFAELGGFAALVVGAWMLHPIAGVLTLGVCLLFVGYATDDEQAVLAVGRVVNPLRTARQARVARRKARKTAKKIWRKRR